jgi:hypothetical protein
LLRTKTTSDFQITQTTDLFYDDEPLGSLLYEETPSSPTDASIFNSAKKLLIYTSEGKLDVSREALERYTTFLKAGHPISRKIFILLTSGAASLLPQWPKSMPPETPAAVGILLEQLWARACDWGDNELSAAVGSRLWEWYEYNHCFGDARTILGKLETNLAKSGNRALLPGIINNYAFQFQKDKNWKEATVHFERAASLAAELEQTADYANSRANYWTCRYELEGEKIAGLIVPELHRLGAILHEAGWLASERKTLVWLARILADGGNPQEGVPLVEKAIIIDEKQNSMYIEQDRQLLVQLKNYQRREKLS